MLARIRRVFWKLNGRVGVQGKIMGIVLGLVLLFGVTASLQIRASLTASLRNELQQRGISIARDVASRSLELILTNNIFSLHELLTDTKANNPNVRYVFVLDTSGAVVTHTFSGGFPGDLSTVNPVGNDERYSLQTLRTEEGLVHDVAVPILGSKAGIIHLGMTEESIDAAAKNTGRRVMAVTLMTAFVGSVAGYILTRVLTGPIGDLLSVTRAVEAGDFSRRAHVWGMDELGQLARGFNDMTESLARADQERTALYNQVKNLYEELKEKEAIQSRLLEQTLTAQEEERKRIARELHDQVGQELSSIRMGLKLIEQAADVSVVQQRVREVRRFVDQTLEEVHRLALALRPSGLDELGLVAALERYVEDFYQKFGLLVDLHVDEGVEPLLKSDVEIALYRIVQEALTNVGRHAEAENASVIMKRRGNMLQVIIEDDGKGFDVREAMSVSSKEKSLGLFGMQERAMLIGGSLEIESEPGMGTSVYVKAPISISRIPSKPGGV